MAMKGYSHSPKLQHYLSIGIRLFNVIYRTLVVESLRLTEMQSVYFYGPDDRPGEVGDKWLFFKVIHPGFVLNRTQHSCVVPSGFVLRLIRVQLVQLYSSIDTDTAWKNSHFILSERSDFHIIQNTSIAIQAFSMHMWDIAFSR